MPKIAQDSSSYPQTQVPLTSAGADSFLQIATCNVTRTPSQGTGRMRRPSRGRHRRAHHSVASAPRKGGRADGEAWCCGRAQLALGRRRDRGSDRCEAAAQVPRQLPKQLVQTRGEPSQKKFLGKGARGERWDAGWKGWRDRDGWRW